MIYLDHAASTPMQKSTLDKLHHSSMNDFANPSSAHKFGRKVSEKIETSRSNILKTLGGNSAGKLIFTSSATESNNMLIKGFRWKRKNSCLFLSRGDHPSLTVPSDHLQREIIDISTHLTNNYEDMENLLKKRHPELLVIAHVNNISGERIDLVKLGRLLKRYDVHFHVDASQSFGKFFIDIQKSFIDSLSLSSHKMGGPRGIGGLYLYDNMSLDPLLHGGEHEYGLRSSTLSTSLIIALEGAILSLQEKIPANLSVVLKLRDHLKKRMKEISSEFAFPFEEKILSPYILTVIFPLCSSDILMRLLEEKDVFISSNSACSSKKKGTSSALTALKISPSLQKYLLRISFSSTTSRAECDRFIEILDSILKETAHLL